MKIKKITHLTAKSFLISALIFSVSTGTVLANGESTQTSVATGETLTATAQVQSIGIQPSGEVLDEPSLIPGDFFYFVKVMVEKIRLAVTVDDYKEAKLLADFAAERIKEANVFLKEGKSEETEKILNAAVSTQVLAEETLSTSRAETSDGNEGSKQESTTNNEGNVTEGSDDIVKNKLVNNMDSLLEVLGKVENLKTQQAVIKNIQKSFEKLNKKFEKLEEMDAKFTKKMNEIKGKEASGQISVEEAGHEKAKLEEELTKKEQKIKAEEARDVEEINNEVAKDTMEATKEQEKKEQEAVKKAEERQREEAKKLEKKQREEAKKAEEQLREQAKKMEQKQREEVKKAEEKQK